MNYISTKELADKWKVNPSLVLRLAREGRIEGAFLFGKKWAFPFDAEKPADGRKKETKKEAKKKSFFRFPIYINYDENSWYPPLSGEERDLRNAQAACLTFDFDKAEALLRPLAKNAKNRYVRLGALYNLCFIDIQNVDVYGYNRDIIELNKELSKYFPYRKEMMILRYRINAKSCFYKPIIDNFRVEPNYSYHHSSYDMITNLSLISLTKGDFSMMAGVNLDNFELQCQQMERNSHIFEAQELHLLLVEIYQIRSDKRMMLHHMNRALTIAMEHKLYLPAAVHSFYYPDVTKETLKSFPENFANMIISSGSGMREKYVKFNDLLKNNPYWNRLSEKEFAFLSFAVAGYSNQQIARNLSITEKTVCNKYDNIYKKLGISTKEELIDLINSTHKWYEPEHDH